MVTVGLADQRHSELAVSPQAVQERDFGVAKEIVDSSLLFNHKR